jgi:anti-anti-sigma factor
MFKIIEKDGVATCDFSGRLDTLACQDMVEEIRGQITKMPDKLIFEMKDVDFIASSFLRVCIEAAQTMPDGAFSIKNVDPIIKKTFMIAGLDNLLHVK